MPGDWGPWTAAHFPTQEARDRFLLAMASNVNDRWGTELALDGLGAWVRWREGHFFVLNDMAYAHRGRIVVSVTHHWVI